MAAQFDVALLSGSSPRRFADDRTRTGALCEIWLEEGVFGKQQVWLLSETNSLCQFDLEAQPPHH